MSLSRRTLLKSAIASTSICGLAPPLVFGQSKRRDDLLRVAAVGIGGQGNSDMEQMKSHPKFRLTAACDVDKSFFPHADAIAGDRAGVKKFQDFRKMFDTSSDSFDAVLIATPDHMHAPIAKLAMEHDKHVYLQKPLAQDIGECRLLAEMANAKPELATQMGIQIHGWSAYRTAVSWIQQGLIGTVNEVHSWSGKGWGGEMPAKESTAAPDHLDWDLYVGVSEFRNYVEGWYHRNNWRKWMAFGTGTQGDMGCHIVDPVFTALELKVPTQITSFGPKPFAENFALDSKVVYSFEGTKYTADQVDMTWYNGGLRPTELAGLPATAKLPHQGSVFVGEKGSLILPHIAEAQVYLPDGGLMSPENLPDKADDVNHYHEWIDAALGEKEKAGAPFEYSGPLTEAILMGTIINRWPEQAFGWDAATCQFTGDSAEVEQANALLRPAYRTDW